MTKTKTDKPSKVTGNYGVLWVAGLIFFISLVGVSIHFSAAELPNCNGAKEPVECTTLYWAEYRASWGQFGDFMGGMVNPFIGLLTIYLLLTTIAQQSRALDQTESALDHASDALAQNATALELTRYEINIAQEEIKIGREIQEKTEQALTAQIAESKSQNNLSNYFVHRAEYIKYLDEVRLEGKDHLITIEERYLHGLIYPHVKLGDRKKNIEIYVHLCGNVADLLWRVSKIDENCDSVRSEFVSSIMDESEMLRASFETFLAFHPISNGTSDMKSSVGGFTGKTYSPVRNAFRCYVRELKCFQICFAFDADTTDYKLRWIIDWLGKCASAYPQYSVEEEASEKNNVSFKNFLDARDSQLVGAKNMLNMLNAEIEYLKVPEEDVA